MLIDIEILRIYLGESALHDGRPTHELLVEEARKRGMAGATAFRGFMGFGANSLIHTSKILRLSEDLPVVVEIVDTPERIRSFLPHAQALLGEGALAVTPGKATFHLPMRVRDLMTSGVAATTPETPLAEVARVLLGRGVKAIPVLEGERPVGIVTGGDLLKRSALGLRLDLQAKLPSELREETLAALETQGLTAREVMSAPPLTVNIRANIPDAAKIMAVKGVKRLVVVDDHGDMAGVLSRVDVLRAYARAAGIATVMPQLPKVLGGAAADAMFREVPSCRPDTPLRQVLDLILSNPLRRVVVTDAAGLILGVVLDGDLIERYVREKRPGLLRSLARLLATASAPGEEWQGAAAEVMHEDVIAVQEDTPLPEVLGVMLHKRVRRLVVSDSRGRLRGMVDRDTILRMLGGLETGE